MNKNRVYFLYLAYLICKACSALSTPLTQVQNETRLLLCQSVRPSVSLFVSNTFNSSYVPEIVEV